MPLETMGCYAYRRGMNVVRAASKSFYFFSKWWIMDVFFIGSSSLTCMERWQLLNSFLSAKFSSPRLSRIERARGRNSSSCAIVKAKPSSGSSKPTSSVSVWLTPATFSPRSLRLTFSLISFYFSEFNRFSKPILVMLTPCSDASHNVLMTVSRFVSPLSSAVRFLPCLRQSRKQFFMTLDGQLSDFFGFHRIAVKMSTL